MIKVLIGDMFESHKTTLVNTINCVGVMGKGVAQQFKARDSRMFNDYQDRCRHKMVKPGIPYLYTDLFGNTTVMFPTKDHWRSPSRLSDIITGLDYFISHYHEWNISSIAFPPLGCGNGGLDWKIVGPIMYEKLSSIDIPIEIYAPYGTPQYELTEEFLSQKRNYSLEKTYTNFKQRIKSEWLIILEVLYQLECQPYTAPVGRTIFQKICYVLTEQGLKTELNFKRESYGPFSDKIDEIIGVFANANLIQEKQLGKMICLKTGPEYLAEREKYTEIFKQDIQLLTKTVDLFCRIKNTEQAEEVATVLYAFKDLTESSFRKKVNENELCSYIFKWKKLWNNAEKQMAITSVIHNLSMLLWIDVELKNDMLFNGNNF